FHTTSVLLGYTAFFVAAFFGVLYLLLHYQIKTAGFGIVFRRMPPLETLGEMCGKAIIPGFILLSSGILMGIYWRNASFPDDPHFDPKVVLTYAIWVYYLLLALGRLSRRLSGKLLAYGTLIGFVLITLNYLVIRFVVSSFHNFG
ncbi:MAG TPA: cytochrome c biogenesis protein CcsA, partial [Calditrichia bacterium]|nr:cytochrome c biogenesis protein CcsA [Calditrichia bacterium]